MRRSRDVSASAGQPPDASAQTPIVRATARFERHGYRVHYADEYLVQLVRVRGERWATTVRVVIFLLGIGLALWAVRAWPRRLRWHVVSLTTTPDARVLVHTQWTDRPVPH